MNPRVLQLATVAGSSAVAAAVVFFGAGHRLDAKRDLAEAERARVAREVTHERGLRAQLAAERDRLRENEAAAQAREAALTPAAVRKEALLTLLELKNARAISLAPVLSRNGRGAFERLSVDAQGRLGADFGELFGLSSAQVDELRTAMERIRARVNELAVAHTTVRRTEAGALVLKTAEAPELGALRERLRAALTRAIGADGLAIYEGLVPTGSAFLFDSFGGRVQTLTLERNGSRFNLLTETGGGGRNIDWNNVERTLGPLAKLVPPDFRNAAP